MLVDKQNELMSDLLFTVHQHGGDDVTRKPPIITDQISMVLGQTKDVQWSIEPRRKSHALVTTSQTLLFLCTLEQTMRLVGAAFWLVFRMSQYNNNPRVRT